MWHWLEHFFGMDNGSGPQYLWWSGMGANFGELTILGAVFGLYRGHNCHEHRCWRLGRHPVDGTPYKACKKHHPDIDHTKPVRLGELP